MIGLVLAYVRPKIEELQDKAIIEQSVAMIKDIDSIILTMGAAGNQRLLELGIKKGELKIDGENDKIIFDMESKYTYSEPGKEVVDGNLIIVTEKIGEFNLVTLTRDYSDNYDITYKEKNEIRVITKSSTSYDMLLSNKGGTKANIDIEII